MKGTMIAVLLAGAGLMAAQGESGSQQAMPGMQVEPDLLKEAAGRPAMRLDEFQKLALATNPTMRQANALVERSAAQARQAGLYPNPSVGYQGEQIRGGYFDGGEQGAFVEQTFVLGGKLALRRNVYEQQRREDVIGVSQQRYQVLSDVGQSFYAAVTAEEIVNTRRKLLALATEAVETAHQLANIGQADVPDELQAEVEAEQAKVDYGNAQRAYLQAFRSLAAVAGRADLPVSPLEADLEHPPQVSADEIESEILQSSPSLKRAQQDVLRAEAEVKSTKRESVPDIQIHAGIQQNFEPINELSRTQVGLQGFATAGVNLPIFNRNQGNVAAAQAERERAQAEVARVQLLLRRRTQQLLQSYLASREAAARYRDAMIPRATRAYQLYLTKYREMGAAYPQVLISQRTLFQLQVEYIRALGNVWQAAIALQNYTLSPGLDAPE